ncbi:hypothetical protein G6F52_014067 [Rhizopus delemar]|nr:hypothetical protein G6F52_014067 [Rhizopus delemar]
MDADRRGWRRRGRRPRRCCAGARARRSGPARGHDPAHPPPRRAHWWRARAAGPFSRRAGDRPLRGAHPHGHRTGRRR